MLVEPVVNREKLRELLALQTEYSTLDFESTCDLSWTPDAVELAKDVRLLRATDPRIADQLRDLTTYRPVSAMPAVARDLSLAVAVDLDAELLGDQVRELLGDEAEAVQEVAVLAETGYDELPGAARRRMGARPGQKNVLLRVVLCHLERTLTSAEANAIRDRIYAGLHEGAAYEWAAA